MTLLITRFLSWIKGCLHDRSRSICFSLALLISFVLTQHTVWGPIYPIEDGEGYAIRSFALYGFLHTGQWDKFWNLLSHPNQSIFPLHDLAFFILPQVFAGVASYVATQNLTTYLLLACAVGKLSQAFNRAEWAPAIFLLSSVNNFALADYGAFYLDMEFFALGLYVIAWQVSAWREKRAGCSLYSGLLLGLLFWMKPANALVFLATFVLSEIGHVVITLHFPQSETSRRRRLLNLFRHWGCQALGFIPVLGLALLCGGAQTILQLIDNNEVHEEAAPVLGPNLIRLFYFPLCLAFYYHILLLGVLVAAAFLVRRWLPVAMKPRGSHFFPGHLFLPVALAFLVFGEFFSFWMLVKPIRCLLVTLPFMGFAFYWLAERRRIPNELIFLMAAVYASMAFLQKTANLLHAQGPHIESTYQLSIASLTEMPSPWTHRGDLDDAICDQLSLRPPPPGIICVNFPTLQKSLTWRLTAGARLQGEPPPYEVRYLFNDKGDYFEQALVGAKSVILKTYSSTHAYDLLGEQSICVLKYGIENWSSNQSLAHIRAMPALRGEPIGYIFLFPQVLTQAQVDQANESTFVNEMALVPGNGSEPIEGIHYTRQEAWQLLRAWFQKRTERSP